MDRNGFVHIGDRLVDHLDASLYLRSRNDLRDFGRYLLIGETIVNLGNAVHRLGAVSFLKLGDGLAVNVFDHMLHPAFA